MAAIQAYREWVDPSKIPTVNSLQTFVGGIGGLVVTQSNLGGGGHQAFFFFFFFVKRF